jgi:hypothetical protein
MEKNKHKDVGYGSPPVKNQFKPGQSGNTKGRPKGIKNTVTMLNEILNSKVIVTDNDKKMKMSRRGVILTQAVSKAMKGDLKAVSILFPVMLESDINSEEKQKVLEVLKNEDKELIKNALKRINGDKNGK